MQVNSSSSSSFSFLSIKSDSQNIAKIKEGASKLDAKSISQGYFMDFQINATDTTSKNVTVQMGLMSFSMPEPFSPSSSDPLSLISPSDLASTGYTGKPLNSLSKDEASALVSDSGYFGVDNTANRIADFVIAAAGDDLGKLQSGLEGVKNGFAQAEKLWGGKLPDISYQTIDKTLALLNDRIASLGGNLINVQA
ncbi:hypothetical protein CIG11343_0404 [Campylobacter iguaniorum]|uniref:hypothetical protein n=1 Tax=Campylobacter iguaniorum TaxID=1244531 RepID=UPI0007C883A1|nr:hypothetical protein [Campylobacter iguaniorum]ANE35486.1 hypothetical protein CIG11343_0404 [Campylobacter iguaniorum]